MDVDVAPRAVICEAVAGIPDHETRMFPPMKFERLVDKGLPSVWFMCLALVVLPSTIVNAQPGSVAAIDSAAAAAADLIETFVEDGGAPGVAVSVGIDGRIVWNGGFGYADIEQRVPVWPEVTRFRVGSVAKPMTALAVGQLYEAGVLDLDAPVQRYVPDFPEKRAPITTRMVAGHIAGIRHYRGDEFLSTRHYDTVAEGLTVFAADTLLFEPGSDYSYSSYGWNLVSAVVEGAARREFLEYMDGQVFEPLGMNQTIADQVTGIIPDRTAYYERDNAGGFVNAPWVDNSYKWAGGGFLSTADDLVRFGFEHLEPTTVSPETVALLQESQTMTNGERTNYGVGWGSGTDDGGRVWAGHTGGSVGGTTFFRVYPTENLVIAVIANLSSVQWDGLQLQIAELFLDATN